MNLKDVLVLLDTGPASEMRFRLAMHIVRKHGACLSAAFIHGDHRAELPSGLGVPRRGLVNRLIPGIADIPQSAIAIDDAKQQFRECHRASEEEGEWHELEHANSAKLTALARAADLIVAGQTNPHVRPAPTWRPVDIVARCGRPVLMVPYIGTFAEVGRRVLVAWDGSREATRSLNDALPVIGAARAVTLMSVHAREKDLERERETTERVVRHLARHGIPARAEQRLQCGSAISDILLSRAMDCSADMIVAGAAHHSSLHDALIGGVSRELFQRMTVPVLISH